MNERINNLLSQIVKFGVLLLVVTTPLLFLPFTSEYFETPKFLILAALTLVMLFLWSFKFLLYGGVRIVRTPIDLALLLLLAVAAVSAFTATSHSVAILGNFPRVHGSLISWFAYILFYFILVSNMKGAKDVKLLINVLVGCGVVLSLVSLLSYVGVFLPVSFAKSLNFTPTGSTFSTTALLALVLPFTLKAALQGAAKSRPAYWALTTLFAAVIALLGPSAVQVAAVVATLLVLVVTPQQHIARNLPLLLIPVVVGIILAVASTYPLVGANKNLIYRQSQLFPQELQLPLSTSWKISVSAFRDAPFFGTGPASYLFDFTSYKPVEFNNDKAWNVRFDQSFNEYLQDLATLGVTGLILMLLLTVVFVSTAIRRLLTEQDVTSQALAIGGITFFVLLALHPSTLVLWIIGVLIIACFMVISPDLTQEFNLGITTSVSSKTQRRIDILPAIVFLLVIIFVGFTAYRGVNFALADYYHRQALNAVAQNKALDAYNYLVKAENLNQFVDLYRGNLAKTNFALANAIASAHAPSDSNSAGSLSDQDKQNIQTLLSQAITEGKVAAFLSPNNPNNWETLGVIYRQISGVAQNAQTFALDSYGRAIQKDPYNPLLRLAVGGIYYQAKNYDLAIRFYTDAVQLKPDFANGWYNLAIAFRDKGDTNSAVAAVEKTISLVDPKSEDYKVATAFLAELKSKGATGNQQGAAPQPASGSSLTPANQTGSALQNNQLPQVLDLPKSENVATPPAVKK